MEERLGELEIKLSFTEDLVEQLNLTVFRQQQQIELLQQELRTLRQQMHAALPADALNLRDELPPHY